MSVATLPLRFAAGELHWFDPDSGQRIGA
jgi:hypothetical protein